MDQETFRKDEPPPSWTCSTKKQVFFCILPQCKRVSVRQYIVLDTIADQPSYRNIESSAIGNRELDIKVLDSSGPNWLCSWSDNFAALGISHLRSPMFFHPCPRDRDGLLAFARETDRCDECVEIANCVGQSMSKHRRKKKTAKGQGIGTSTTAALEIDERDRKDYFTPSTVVFEDYCRDVVRRYDLEHVVDKAQVASIDYGPGDDFGLFHDSDSGASLFKVTTTAGDVKFAKIVVLAVGAGGSPCMPQKVSTAGQQGACHSTQLPQRAFLSQSLVHKIAARLSTTVMVIGGGLTAAQIAPQCIEKGVKRVFMVMRSSLKCNSPTRPYLND